MKRLLVAVVLALALAAPSFAGAAGSMKVASTALEVGMSSEELGARLPADVVLRWKNVPASPAGVRKADLVRRSDHGFLAAVEFTGDRLTQASRLVGPLNYKAESADALTEAIVATLASWRESGGGGPGVTVSDLRSDGDRLHEVVFRSGDLELRLVETANLTQLIENLGRTDQPRVSVTP